MNNYQIPSYFSPQQKEAIQVDDTNVLVSAAAGCGKTTLLVERILRKIIDKRVPLNKLIVVTFTEAAASELKERIETKLNEILKEQPDNAFIQLQLSQLSDAYIMTFHALCLRLLKENQVAFNYSDKLQPGSDLVINNLKQQAFNKLANEYSDETIFQSLNDYYSNPIDNLDFLGVLEDVRKLTLSNGGFEVFMNYHQNTNNPTTLLKHENFKQLFKEYLYDNLNTCLDLLNFSLNDDHLKKNDQTKINETIEQINYFIKLVDVEQQATLQEELSKFKFFTKPQKIKEYDDESIPLIRVFHGKIKNILNDDIKKLLDELSSIEIVLNNNDDNALGLLKYAQIYDENLKVLKKQTGLIEFDDFEQEALALLYDKNEFSQKALELKRHFHEILIDEYQDTNLVQEKIVQALSNGSNTFMVGDLKQSIYGFRKATPQLFVDKYELYKKSNVGKVIDLTGNYRSKKEVLETTNFIFKSIFSKQLGGIDYDDENKLNFANLSLNEKYPNTNLTNFYYNILDPDRLDLDESEIKAMMTTDTKFINSALNVVSEINKLHQQGVNYREICILVKNRTRSEFLIDIIDSYQIPYMFHTNTGFFATYEIKDLTNLLRTLINPNDDVALLGSLHSFFFNLDENDLLTISLEDGYSYYEKLKNSSYQDTLTLLNKLINYAANNHPLDIINYIFLETNYLSYLVNFKTYQQFISNITSLKNLINENFDYYNSLTYLIEDIEGGINKSFDSASPAVLSKKDDVINIMSIHQSKGLEFNYVFLFDDAYTRSSANKNKIKHYKNQLVLPYFNYHNKLKASNPLDKLISFADKRSNIAEELRLLYVALTRAKVQLYIFTNIKQDYLENHLIRLENTSEWLLSPDLIMEQKSLMGYITLALLRHRNALALRKGFNLNTLEEITNYENDLFSLQPYDVSLQQKRIDKKDSVDDFKVVMPKITSQEVLETITPSKHYLKPLDFDKITSFNTYAQGSNTHLVLELVDFNNPNDLTTLFEQYQISKVNQQGIQAFLSSAFFKENILSNTYYKEYNFTYLKDNKLINGIIDLYVESDEEIYIIDYKSDQVSKDELNEYYTSQLQVYYDVISNISNKQISCLIYSLYHQEFIKLL